MADVQFETMTRNRDMLAMMADGYPVRTVGSAGSLRPHLMRGEGPIKQLSEAVEAVTLTDEDIPLLFADVDKAQFSIPPEQSLCEMLKSINPQTTAEELSALADEWLKELEFHLYEG